MSLDELYWYNRGFNDAMRRMIDHPQADRIAELEKAFSDVYREYKEYYERQSKRGEQND